MKRNFSTVLTDQKGKTLTDAGGEITYARVASTALLADLKDDRPDTKLQRWKLALKVDGGGEIELTVAEATAILERVTLVCPTVIVGRFDEFLNG